MAGETLERRALPPEVAKSLKAWDHQAWTLRTISYALGLIAVTSSILVASGLGDPADQWRQIAAIVSAVAAGLLTSLGTVRRSNGMRGAWRLLRPESIKYSERVEKDDALALEALLEVYAKAEALIGDAEISVAGP